MPEKLNSRKLWAAIIGVVLFFIAENTGLSIPQEAVYLLIFYIGGQSVVDAFKEFRTKHPPEK